MIRLSPPAEGAASGDVAAYIADMLSELAKLAADHDYKTLAASIRMAQVQAVRHEALQHSAGAK